MTATERLAEADAHANAVVSFENLARYQAQSRDFRDGRRAEPPPREPLSRELRPA